jgi:hypothetical protein
MPSPFSGSENAVLTFQIPVAGSATTNAVGNRKASEKESVIIKALLKQDNDPSSVNTYAKEMQQLAGADGFAVLLKGYLVEPTTYPNSIKFLSECDAEVTFGIGKVEKGRFKLLPEVQSPFLVSANIDIVTKIRGIFRKN